jgi:putative hydrolase of HD superfamily
LKDARLGRDLLLKVFRSAYMRRWNDKLRPVELTELDKQAHKMMIAFVMAHLDGSDVNYRTLVQQGFFDMMSRIALTDLKPKIYYEIKKDKGLLDKLNAHIKEEISPVLGSFCSTLATQFEQYLEASEKDESIERRILDAAHFWSTKWEFDHVLVDLNQHDAEVPEIIGRHKEELGRHCAELKGLRDIVQYRWCSEFLDLCGQLRYQKRWAPLYRIPETSVLGHSLYVGIVCYLFSEITEACDKLLFNNFFTGLFHDLPEALTRDIITPVKRSSVEFDKLVSQLEEQMMKEKIVDPIQNYHPDFVKLVEFFSRSPFQTSVDGQFVELKSDEIKNQYNHDKHNSRDGELVRAADKLALFVEAYEAEKNGCPSPDFGRVKKEVVDEYRDRVLAGINFGSIYASFASNNS